MSMVQQFRPRWRSPPPFRSATFDYIALLVLCLRICPEPSPLTLFPIILAHKPGDDDGQISLLTKTKTKTERPPLYKVMLLNDDYTPMEFVVHVLERFFGLTHAQSFEIMLAVHKKGLAVVGVFSFEVAETKVAQVMDFARRHQHPLQCTMEKE